MRSCALVMVLSLACACHGPRFPRVTDIQNLRVLAIRGEPAELPREGGLSVFTPLVVGVEGELTWSWELCPFPGPELLSRECLVPEFQCVLGVGETAEVFLPPLDELLGSDEVQGSAELAGFELPDDASLEVQVRLTVTQWGPSCEDDPCEEGTTCTATADLLPTGKSCEELYLGVEPDWEPQAPDQKADLERVCVQQREAVKGLKLVNSGPPNTNPQIHSVRLEAGDDKVTWSEGQHRTIHVVPDGHPMGDPDVYYVVAAKPGAQEANPFAKSTDGMLPISVLISDDVREVLDLDGVAALEERVVSWFADVGSWESSRSGEVGAEPEDGLSAFGNLWIPPSLDAGEQETGTLWAVLRDGRGGVAWVSRTFTFLVEP